ncbi:MAG: type II toxin-antitoxin system RelE/ParE family toxin [Burkholderiaceae bacterium]|jgi:phage-related protein
MKLVEFRGNALEDLRAFPELAKREAGYQIDRVQNGLEPDDFKPMATVGKSVYEIRVQEPSGAFRVIYIAKLEQFVYVLHCFQKKTQRTSKKDIDLAKSRFRELEKEIRDGR